MTAVKNAPARIPNRGLEKVDMIRIKGSESRNGDMEELIMPIPINNTPNPARIWPMCWSFGSLIKTISTTPTKANIGASSPTSRAMSRPVTVVPMLAPMMIQTAWPRVIIPAFTKPTTITVVAEEDWMTAVMAAPTSTPKKRLAVSRSRILFIRAPAAASRPELIICIPCKNNARPPSSPNISEMPISFFPFSRSPSRQEKRHSPRLNVQEQVMPHILFLR